MLLVQAILGDENINTEYIIMPSFPCNLNKKEIRSMYLQAKKEAIELVRIGAIDDACVLQLSIFEKENKDMKRVIYTKPPSNPS